VIFLLACTETLPIETDAEFTSRVQERVVQRLTEHTVEVAAPLQLAVTGPGDFSTTLYLESLYAECTKAPERCDEELLAYVDRQGRMAQARGAPLKVGLLRPQAMPADEARALQLESEPLTEDLVVVLAMDTEAGHRLVSETELRAVELDWAGAMALARTQHPCLEAQGDTFCFDETWTRSQPP